MSIASDIILCVFIDSLLRSSPDRLQLGGHDSREGDGPPWQTGVGLAGRVGESYKHGLYRDVRTPVNVMASQCSVCSTLDHKRMCEAMYTAREDDGREAAPTPRIYLNYAPKP